MAPVGNCDFCKVDIFGGQKSINCVVCSSQKYHLKCILHFLKTNEDISEDLEDFIRNNFVCKGCSHEGAMEAGKVIVFNNDIIKKDKFKNKLDNDEISLENCSFQSGSAAVITDQALNSAKIKHCDYDCVINRLVNLEKDIMNLKSENAILKNLFYLYSNMDFNISQIKCMISDPSNIIMLSKQTQDNNIINKNMSIIDQASCSSFSDELTNVAKQTPKSYLPHPIIGSSQGKTNSNHGNLSINKMANCSLKKPSMQSDNNSTSVGSKVNKTSVKINYNCDKQTDLISKKKSSDSAGFRSLYFWNKKREKFNVNNRQFPSRQNNNAKNLDVFVSRLPPLLEEGELIKKVKLEIIKINDFKCWKLKTKFNSYSSFYFSIFESDIISFFDLNNWPQGTLIKFFKGKFNEGMKLIPCDLDENTSIKDSLINIDLLTFDGSNNDSVGGDMENANFYENIDFSNINVSEQLGFSLGFSNECSLLGNKGRDYTDILDVNDNSQVKPCDLNENTNIERSLFSADILTLNVSNVAIYESCSESTTDICILEPSNSEILMCYDITEGNIALFDDLAIETNKYNNLSIINSDDEISFNCNRESKIDSDVDIRKITCAVNNAVDSEITSNDGGIDNDKNNNSIISVKNRWQLKKDNKKDISIFSKCL